MVHTSEDFSFCNIQRWTLLGRIASSDSGLLFCYARSSVVGRSVCLLYTFVSPAKTAEPIEMPFGMVTRVGPRNHVLDGDADPQRKRATFGGANWRPIVSRDRHCNVSAWRVNQRSVTHDFLLYINIFTFLLTYLLNRNASLKIARSRNRCRSIDTVLTYQLFLRGANRLMLKSFKRKRFPAANDLTICAQGRYGLSFNYFDHLLSLLIYI